MQTVLGSADSDGIVERSTIERPRRPRRGVRASNSSPKTSGTKTKRIYSTHGAFFSTTPLHNRSVGTFEEKKCAKKRAWVHRLLDDIPTCPLAVACPTDDEDPDRDLCLLCCDRKFNVSVRSVSSDDAPSARPLPTVQAPVRMLRLLPRTHEDQQKAVPDMPGPRCWLLPFQHCAPNDFTGGVVEKSIPEPSSKNDATVEPAPKRQKRLIHPYNARLMRPRFLRRNNRGGKDTSPNCTSVWCVRKRSATMQRRRSSPRRRVDGRTACIRRTPLGRVGSVPRSRRPVAVAWRSNAGRAVFVAARPGDRLLR